jgi:class 3 adenylate cyclase/tetratricopeptide (TPR) repeat protein
VTVLFCDVVGSTPLGEQLDPESLRRVMARWFEAARSVLERHGGSVEKFIGDAVMAVFGVPKVHEDDAVRAVRAAADLRDALADLNAQLERDFGVRIDVRIGVNTGEVVTGTEERLATGDVVNVAARLEQAAQPGEALLGDPTWRLVRDAIEAEQLDPLEVRGKDEALTAWRLLAVRPGAAGVARRLDSAFVGRERERGLLNQAFERTVQEQACHLFTLLGTAGVGKSRLVEEFLSGIGDDATVLRGRCLPYGEGITYWPIAEIVRELPSPAEPFDDPDEGRLVRERLSPVLGAGDVGSADEIAWAVRKLFERLAGKGPLVVVFDDIHWAAPTFLDLIEHVADWSREAPILLVCVARPELHDARPGWAGGKLNATSVLLEPLGAEHAELLIEGLLGEASLDDPALQRISEAAEGNPLYVEEMIAMLIDGGQLARTNGAWELTGDATAIPVPATISALLAARLDRLEPDERSVLECAAVEGKAFHRGAVVHLAPERVEASVSAHLLTLVRKELIRPRQPDFPGEDAFRFRHLLIRDAAYEALSKEARAELHERFAAWLEVRAGEHVPEYEEIVGYHFEQAYAYRRALGPLGDAGIAVGRAAALRLGRAGRRALVRLDLPAAVNLLGRAATLLPRTDPERLRLVPQLGLALTQAGRLAEAEAALTDAVEAALEAGDRRAELFARLHLAYARGSMSPEHMYDQLGVEARSAIVAFEELGDHAGLARAWHVVGLHDMWAGRDAEAETDFERAVEYARMAGDEWQQNESLPWLTGAAFYGPRPVDEVERRIEEVIERSGGDWRIEAWSSATLCGARAMQGRFAEARQARDRAKVLLEELGLLLDQTWAAHFFGWLEVLAGDPAAAEAELRRGCEISRQVGDSGYLSTTLAILAGVVSDQGRHEEALRLSHEAEEVGGAGDVTTQVLSRSARAMALARLGRVDEAEPLARDAVARARMTDKINEIAHTLDALAETLRLAGRPDEARDAQTEALSLYERKGNVVMARRARELLT